MCVEVPDCAQKIVFCEGVGQKVRGIVVNGVFRKRFQLLEVGFRGGEAVPGGGAGFVILDQSLRLRVRLRLCFDIDVKALFTEIFRQVGFYRLRLFRGRFRRSEEGDVHLIVNVLRARILQADISRLRGAFRH